MDNRPTVYFTDLRTSPGNSLPQKLQKLVRRAGIGQIDFKDKFTAIKIHFGEPGNIAYIRHNYVAALVDLLKEMGAKGINILTNVGEMAGQSVPHFHVHVIPRYVRGEGGFQLEMNAIDSSTLNLPALAKDISKGLK